MKEHRGGFRSEVLTTIHASYYVAGGAPFRVVFPILLCPKGQGFQPAASFPSPLACIFCRDSALNEGKAKQQRSIGPAEKRCNYCLLEQVIRGKWNR